MMSTKKSPKAGLRCLDPQAKLSGVKPDHRVKYVMKVESVPAPTILKGAEKLCLKITLKLPNKKQAAACGNHSRTCFAVCIPGWSLLCKERTPEGN